ncbi:MAG: cellulase N-terminal Ig-like domain-containing protein [Cyanobacteria bacterium P01_A01_bin.83]
MRLRAKVSLWLVLFTALIVGLSSLDSDLETLTKAAQAKKPTAIVVNQVGYLPRWQKTAFLLNNQKPTTHPQLIDRDTRKVVKTIQPEREIQDTATPDAISTIDFTDITQPGTYYLKQGYTASKFTFRASSSKCL